MMHPVLSVFLKEFRENLRERRTVFSALVVGPLLGPLLFALAIGTTLRSQESGSERRIVAAVVHPQRAPNLLAFLKQYGVDARPADYDEAAARAAVRAQRETLVLEVPGSFGAHLAQGVPAALVLYADTSDPQAQRAAATVRALLREYSQQLARLRLSARGMEPLLLSPLVVQDVDVATPAGRSALLLGALSYLLLLAMLTGGMYLAIDATAGERERGTLEPLLTLPLPRAWLMYGKLLATCAYMLLSLSICVCAFAVVLRFTGLERFGMSVNLGPWVALRIVLYCLPLVPAGAALMTIVAAGTRSYREAQTWIGLVLLLPTLPLVFAAARGLKPSLPLMAVPSLSQHFLIGSLLREEPLPAGWIALSALATAVVAAALVGIAGRLYRRESLLG
ncbi:MAG: ABC transporter permease [Proteobacteria bacterium]|nr:ABC transporter permease [Pseudomonadota bacterium]